MKQVGELNRVNYALTKHHRELMHQKIDPHLIENIEVAENPSLNYKNAFKSVYHDQLERTIEFQEQKRQRQKQQGFHMCQGDPVNNRSSQSSCYSKQSPLQNVTNQPTYQLGRSNSQNRFVDYHEDKITRNEGFVNRNLDGGSSFFRAQDDYQRRKHQELEAMKNILQQQLRMKELNRLQATEVHNQQVEEVKQNRYKQIELEQYRNIQRKQQKSLFGDEIKQQMQFERIKKVRKSYFEYSHEARHNPITNPIEYHIDNPYILQKLQTKSYNYQ